MFIDREAFVQDYQRRSFDSQFCSAALINAVCSIGALMSPNPDIRKRASYYSHQAIDMIMNHGLVTPHTTSVQTLLCCAFFEIGAGNLSRAWLLSGAFPKWRIRPLLTFGSRNGVQNGSRLGVSARSRNVGG